MTSSYDDSVINFDLGFLHQTSKNTGNSRLEKQRKAILLAKQKTITTDGLIRKYYDKKEVLEQTERTLFASKEECKQVCIDYKNVLEKCERLENEIQVIHHYNQQLQQKLSDAENQCCGIQSHARQLELLVKEQETKIDSLKIESHLEKSNIKNFATSTSTLQKQNDILLQDLCILGKLLIANKKLKPQHEAVLQKYQKYLKYDDDSCNDSGGDHSDNEIDLFDDNLMSPQSPLCLEKDQKVQSSSVEVQDVIVVNLSSTGKDETSKPNEIDGCSVSSNDIASADTGRGSSLAFSDSEKCFRSPDYLSHDNHSSSEFTRKSINVNSVGTSPIRDSIDKATSPIIFETLSVPTFTFDKAVSPLKSTNVSNSAETSSSQITIDHSLQNDPNNQCSSLQTEKCLQVNNSNNYDDECSRDFESNNNDDECSRDCEIEMILSKMQFDRDLITPMPSSPCGSHSTVVSRVSGCQTNHSDFIICQDAAKLKEENKILHANIADLAKEIVSIKNILKMNPLVLPETNTNQKNVSKIAEISKSNASCGRNNNIIEQKLINHSKNDNENNELIGIVDLVHKSGSEDMASNDFCDMLAREHEQNNNLCVTEEREHVQNNDLCDMEAREQEQNNEDLFNLPIQSSDLEVPIVIIEQQENTPEGIMSRLEFEEDPSPIQSTPENLYDINSNLSEANTEQNSVENMYNCNVRVRRRPRPINKLEKLRRKIVPKCKIRREKAQLTRKRLISRLKQIGKSVRQTRLNAPKKKVSPADSSASLNDKTVYNNAVKIMTELKEKQSEEAANKSLSPKNTTKSPKKRLFDVSKLSFETTDKPFDISDLLSKQTLRPVIKSVSAPHQTQKYIGVDKQQNKQSLKCIQPIMCIDQLRKKTDRKIQCIDKTRNNKITKGPLPVSLSVNTRSRSRIVEKFQTLDHERSEDDDHKTQEAKEGRKRLKRVASDENQEIVHKRILRSSTRLSNCENVNSKLNNNTINGCINENSLSKPPKVYISSKNEKNLPLNNGKATENKPSEYYSAISYDDLDMFDLDMFDEREPKRKNILINESEHRDPKTSILCTMLDRYSLSKIRFYPKKTSDEITNTICALIEESIKQINELQPKETKTAMDHLQENLQSWNEKQILSGLMKYLQKPERKVELYSKVSSPPAPPMTKSEQILIYVVMQLRNVWLNVDMVDHVLSSIEYTMFQLNRSPEFDTIESMSHFYAVLCRYFKLKTRLRLFMLDAMYCMQYKAIALIRQCMDVWMHILPLAHMGIAKNPLVTCVVYLLHFYKCEDHFNRVRDIRNILNRKYSYHISEWNETKILEMFRNAIYELKDIPIEKKMLRLSLIILAKRQGARWCQKNIITNVLQPIIENKDSSDIVKIFCVSMLGPLVKPYPVNMKVHCEIVINLLLDMAKQNPSPSMEEAIYTSLIYLSKHSQNRVINALVTWHPELVSLECEEILRDFIREKPASAWKSILSNIKISEDILDRTEDE